jgi:cytidine deaminase
VSHTDEIHTLIEQAQAAAAYAYIPYSNYAVGAALRGTDGRVFTGCNVENASYPACICAERTALVKAVSEGVQSFDLLVVATENGGSPCGVCRQMLYEFAPDLRVITVDRTGTVHLDLSLSDLLANGFGPKMLRE